MPVNIVGTLRAALRQLESERARVDRQLETLRRVVDGAPGTPRRGPSRRRRRMNAAARRAISQRMKAYWAKRRAQRDGVSHRGKRKAKTT